MSETDHTRRRSRNELGAEGERRAADHLAARGYRIVGRNVRAGGVEMDLIVRRGRLVVFVEVKTRRAGGPGCGEDAVDARKQLRLVRGAAAWIHEQPRPTHRVRFDVIVCECSRDERDWRLRHLEAAFDANA
ncbi:MAG: YraN family protein [Deltaproteobacteria bacterium]|nr:YraN family protein [Deltaproteobacteria bacterium]MBW2578652.1 YraN family protein [Deltaproteobacteria bacterium]